MALSRADFGSNPHAGKSRNNAHARGWGQGWPNCQRAKMRQLSAGGIKLTVRREIVPLVEALLTATVAMGYRPKSGQSWGYACRPIRGSKIASNHSWGLAVDLNSSSNPMSSNFRTDIPPKVVKMWEACGFYWGGRYLSRPDTMHFEYLGKPSAVAIHTRKAKTYPTKAKPVQKVSLAAIIEAAHADPPARQGKAAHRAPVKLIEKALVAEGYLAKKWADGSFGTKTIEAYAAWQRSERGGGYRGRDADGIPGKSSLARLGKRHGFKVIS